MTCEAIKGYEVGRKQEPTKPPYYSAMEFPDVFSFLQADLEGQEPQ